MTKANLFVFLQLALILILFLNAGVFADFPWIILQALAFLIGTWAIIQFKVRDLAISPKPKEEASLVISGPYRWIRNPMYLAVLLWCLPLVIEANKLSSLIIYLSLVVILNFKLNYEEGLLKKKYPEYDNYCNRSKKLIPFIY